MTDKYDKKTGSNEVSQSKDAHDISDNSNDVEKISSSENHSKDMKEKLDRGEELYTGFGFDNRENSNDLKTEKIDTIAVNKAANNSKDHKTLEKEVYEVPTDESIVEEAKNGKNVKAVAVKAIEREDVKPSTTNKKNTTNNNSTIVIKADGKNVKSQNDKIKSAKIENKVSHKDEKKDNSTIVIKTPSKDKVTQDKEKVNYKNTVNSKHNDLKDERKVSNYKEIPEETKLVIKADNGDISYREKHLRNDDRKLNKDYNLAENKTNYKRRNHKVLDFPVSESNTRGQVPADYQLKSTHYSNDLRANTLYNTPGSVYKNYNTVSIKNHYKSKKKLAKRGLSLGKVAIAVAAVAGISLIFLPEEDDCPFRF